MRIKEVIWLPDFEDQIEQKHGISDEEVEDVLFSNTLDSF